jgi:RimJ/RimL family protein N-acetyltransferase
MLVAGLAGQPVAYIRLDDHIAPETIWVTDVVVTREERHKGIATALLLSAQKWAMQRDAARIVAETTSKNYAMIALAQKLGFEFSGYHNQYYPSRDIALFFSRFLR